MGINLSPLKAVFKNVGHAIASGAKYFESHLVPEAVAVAQGAQALQPEVDAILTAIAGPQAASINDIALNVFGEVAAALEPLGGDQLAAVQANGLNLKLDLSVIQDVKGFAALIRQLLATRGTPAPAPAPKA